MVLDGFRLDLGGTHPGWYVGTFRPIPKCHRGALERPKMTPKCHKWGIWGHMLEGKNDSKPSSLFCVTVLFLYLCLLWLYVFYGFCVGPAKLQCGATPASVTMAWFTQFWQFGAILSPSGVLRWQCRNGKMVPNHRPGCPQPWSNLDPPWSSHLGSPVGCPLFRKMSPRDSIMVF